ncbi:MAG: hypothetical protein KDI31_06750 [Pseudomonadales bacterium]|nr:hypothetical protein [Pseudomonadales bacterium]
MRSMNSENAGSLTGRVEAQASGAGFMRRMAVLAAGALLSVFLIGCEKEGPAERAGESIDETVDDVRDRIGEAGDSIDDMADDARDAVEDAADDAGDALRDARDEVEDAVEG